MENNEQTKTALNAFNKPMKGHKAEEFNPMESIPTISAGNEFEVGMTICGKFVETQKIASHKFKSQEKDEKGVPVQYRHILEREDGVKLGIWNAGELKLGFSKLKVGTYVELTYLGKKDVNGTDQHTFSWKTSNTAH